MSEDARTTLATLGVFLPDLLLLDDNDGGEGEPREERPGLCRRTTLCCCAIIRDVIDALMLRLAANICSSACVDFAFS